MANLVELKSKSQVTIPKDIVNSLQLHQGDQFEAIVDDGRIILVPVAIYPQKVVDELVNTIDEMKVAIENGDQPTFDSMEDLIKELQK